VTTTDTDWRTRARQLAQHLAENGVLDDPAWRAAFESVPRHVFVPRFYRQQPDGEWSETTSEDDDWLDAVYSDEPLVTALAEIESGSVYGPEGPWLVRCPRPADRRHLTSAVVPRRSDRSCTGSRIGRARPGANLGDQGEMVVS
jgi:hypothetical protein